MHSNACLFICRILSSLHWASNINSRSKSCKSSPWMMGTCSTMNGPWDGWPVGRSCLFKYGYPIYTCLFMLTWFKNDFEVTISQPRETCHLLYKVKTTLNALEIDYRGPNVQRQYLYRFAGTYRYQILKHSLCDCMTPSPSRILASYASGYWGTCIPLWPLVSEQTANEKEHHGTTKIHLYQLTKQYTIKAKSLKITKNMCLVGLKWLVFNDPRFIQ